MRCLAVAEGWRDRGGGVTFIAPGTSRLTDRLVSDGWDVSRVPRGLPLPDDARRTAEAALAAESAWVVLDGYRFGADYESVLRRAALRLMTIDDMGPPRRYHCNVLLNQNAYAEPSMYPEVDSGCRLLLGPAYVLLRREFRMRGPAKRSVPRKAGRVLISMGGGDASNMTARVLEALKLIPSPTLEAVVLVGADNPNAESIKEAAAAMTVPVRIDTGSGSVPDWMAWAHVAVLASGTTAWEAAFMGLPALVVPIVDNQSRIAQALHSAGAAEDLGDPVRLGPREIADPLRRLVDDPERRGAMSSAGPKLIDGQGVERVCAALARGAGD